MLRAIIVVGVLGGAAIACTSASKTYGPSGREGYSINCSGPRHSWSDCYEKAGDICGTRGYQIVEKSDEPETRVSFGRSVYEFERAMLVECSG